MASGAVVHLWERWRWRFWVEALEQDFMKCLWMTVPCSMVTTERSSSCFLLSPSSSMSLADRGAMIPLQLVEKAVMSGWCPVSWVTYLLTSSVEYFSTFLSCPWFGVL